MPLSAARRGPTSRRRRSPPATLANPSGSDPTTAGADQRRPLYSPLPIDHIHHKSKSIGAHAINLDMTAQLEKATADLKARATWLRLSGTHSEGASSDSEHFFEQGWANDMKGSQHQQRKNPSPHEALEFRRNGMRKTVSHASLRIDPQRRDPQRPNSPLSPRVSDIRGEEIR